MVLKELAGAIVIHCILNPLRHHTPSIKYSELELIYAPEDKALLKSWSNVGATLTACAIDVMDQIISHTCS